MFDAQPLVSSCTICTLFIKAKIALLVGLVYLAAHSSADMYSTLCLRHTQCSRMMRSECHLFCKEVRSTHTSVRPTYVLGMALGLAAIDGPKSVNLNIYLPTYSAAVSC